MWEPKYCPRQYLEDRKPLPVVLRRSCGRGRDEKAHRSTTYGLWNDGYGVRCGLWDGLWDDMLFQGSRSARSTRNATTCDCQMVPFKSSAPRYDARRYDALATPKAHGCGPNCKKSRCAATDTPEYAQPHWEAYKRRARKGGRRGSTAESPSIYSTMAHVQDRVLDLGRYDMTMGLKSIKVEEQEDLQVLPSCEPTCERNCGECSEAPRESTEEEVETHGKRNGTQGSGLKSLTRTRSVGSNTEEEESLREVAEVPVGVLQDARNNKVPNWSDKVAPSAPRWKIPTPIPRVAFLRPPKPRRQDIIEYGEQGDGLPAQRPPTPRLSNSRFQKPAWSASPVSLTSRRVTASRISPQIQKLMPGKLAPRLFTHTGLLSRQSPQSTEPEKPEHNPEPPELQPLSPSLQPSSPTSQQSLNQSLKQSSTQTSPQSSKESSKADSLVTSVSDFENSSSSTEGSHSESIPEDLTPFCMCSLCGKCESINNTSHSNSVEIYTNNPLYSPERSTTTTVDPRTAQNSNIASSRWSFLYTFLEIMFLVVLAGVLTVGMIPYVESVFRAYVADYCKCSAKVKGVGGAQVTADGMQGGIVKWVSCMMDDSRCTLTPVR